MEFQNVCDIQFVKSFTVYYIKCAYPKIWVYVQEFRWELVEKIWVQKTK
jgi:hypothetical protein